MNVITSGSNVHTGNSNLDSQSELGGKGQGVPTQCTVGAGQRSSNCIFSSSTDHHEEVMASRFFI